MHVEQARAAGLEAMVGDARKLDQADHSVDVVLVLGPLYHLPNRFDRDAALNEAHVEGPGFLIRGLDERLDDPARREALMKAIRLVEEDPLMHASGHLLAVGRAPAG